MVLKHNNQYTHKTHCKYGHSFEGDNLLIRKEGWRSCRKCRDFRNYEYRIKHLKINPENIPLIKLIEASKHQKLFSERSKGV